MGYFSNGSEGHDYEDRYCSRCVHYENCAILNAHFLYNYAECNNPESILHMLIPRTKNGLGNGQCKLFYEGESTRTPANIPLKGSVMKLKNRVIIKETL